MYNAMYMYKHVYISEKACGNEVMNNMYIRHRLQLVSFPSMLGLMYMYMPLHSTKLTRKVEMKGTQTNNTHKAMNYMLYMYNSSELYTCKRYK